MEGTFYPMNQFPKRATDLSGNEENFSVTVLTYDQDDNNYCELAFYNFDTKEWIIFGDDSIKLICWCYVPNPTEFLKGKRFKAVKHSGYQD